MLGVEFHPLGKAIRTMSDNLATPPEPLTLWYAQAATHWVDALPIGNGRLGAMIYGGVDNELLQLNHDTLWSGGPRDTNNPQGRALLPEIRRLIAAGAYTEADELCQQTQGPYTESYLPLADLALSFPSGPTTAAYRRDLDLHTAVASVRYTNGSATFTREMFVSAPDQVLVVHLSSDQPASLSFKVTLNSQLRAVLTSPTSSTLELTGKAPKHVDPSYVAAATPVIYDDEEGMAFSTMLQVVTQGGSVHAGTDGLEIVDADSAMLLLTAATSWNGYNRSPGREGLDPIQPARATLAAAAQKTYQQLRDAHIEDYRHLFGRVELDLGTNTQADQPTDVRLRAYHTTSDPQLATLLFQYGRYLLIASSRPGTQPANLQGIWNAELRAPWSSNWTININTEMNYWLAETTNLAECHAPLFDLIEGLSETGHVTADVCYGCRGWVAHHNTDLWRHSSQVGDGTGKPVWTTWQMGGAWLCQHLWEHYAFGGDKNFLRQTAYPAMKGAAEFCLDWLFENEQGYLVTAPSTSPEAEFITPSGESAAVSQASTNDMAIIWDLFTNCIAAADALQTDAAFAAQLTDARARLVPPQIGARGQIQEWSEDLIEAEIHHRHTSHLFGLHPGRQITPETTPDLAAAAKRTLEIRGDLATGWSMAWKINLWARLHDGDHAHLLIRDLLTPVESTSVSVRDAGGLYLNLLCAHPPFQIDGNFGYTAAIAEMLLQSHLDTLEFLPALPHAWANGRVKGLRARGGFEVDITWQDHAFASAVVIAQQGGICQIRSDRPLHVQTAGTTVTLSQLSPGLLAWETQPGARYEIQPGK